MAPLALIAGFVLLVGLVGTAGVLLDWYTRTQQTPAQEEDDPPPAVDAPPEGALRRTLVGLVLGGVGVLGLVCFGVVIVAPLAGIVARSDAAFPPPSSWPRAVAIVDEARLRSLNETNYQTVIVYHYEVEGQRYDAEQLLVLDAPRDEAQVTADAYPPGSTVYVRYIPGVPRMAYIRPPADTLFYFVSGGLLIGVVGLPIVTLYSVSALRRRGQRT